MSHDKDVIKALLRNDLVSFIAKTFQSVDGSQKYMHNWHIDLIANHLVRAYRGEIKRLIITLPPRNLKSVCASIAFPAWVLGQDPTKRIICASYSNDLSSKLARDCRTVLETDWYQKAFPKTRLNKRKNAEDEFETTANGYRLATSVGGTLTGKGGSILIIDDPMKPQEALSSTKRKSVKQWYDSTLYSRLDDKRNDVIIVIMQRLHVDDLVPHLLEKEDWIHLNLPAIAETPEKFELDDGRVFTRNIGDILHPEREPIKVLEQAKSNLGSFLFNAQYQQNPLSESGNIIKWDWFKVYGEFPHFESFEDNIVQSWDTAMKTHDGSDWSACTTWAVVGTHYFLIDVFREQLDFPSLKQKVIDLKAKFQANTILIEDKGSGTGLIQQLRSEGIIQPIAINPVGSKTDRMTTQSATIEAGYVHIPDQVPWLDSFRNEILGFPFSKNDDQVDSVSQFLNWAQNNQYQIKEDENFIGVLDALSNTTNKIVINQTESHPHQNERQEGQATKEHYLSMLNGEHTALAKMLFPQKK